MQFGMIHKYLDIPREFFDENSPPNWLVSNDFKWWFEGFVLKLDVGDSLSSDFHIIKRIS